MTGADEPEERRMGNYHSCG